MVSGCVYALLAGVLAAAASLSAKLTVGADYLRELCESGLSRWDEVQDGHAVCDWVSPVYFSFIKTCQIEIKSQFMFHDCKSIQSSLSRGFSGLL